MAKIKNPILFSQHFGIDASTLKNEGLIDPFINIDTQLFIDPVLIEKSSNKVIREDALDAFRTTLRILSVCLAFLKTKEMLLGKVHVDY